MQTYYVQKGTSNYNFTLCHTYQRPSNENKMPLGVDIQKLIVELKKNKRNEALNVLDIGTGNGDFIKENHDPSSVCVYGISLDDDCLTGLDKDSLEKLRKFEKDPSKMSQDEVLEMFMNMKQVKLEQHQNHHFCNIEQLEENSPIRERQYDLIVSQFTWIHLKNPFEALKTAYNLLKEDGILMIDMIYTEDALPFLKALNSKGYKFISGFSPNGCAYFFIKKTTEDLDISLEIDELSFNLEQFNLSTSPFLFVQILAAEDFFGIVPKKILNKPFTTQQSLNVVQTQLIEINNSNDEPINNWQPNQWGTQIDNKANNLHIFTYVCATDKVKELLQLMKNPSSLGSGWDIKDLANPEWLYQPNEQGYLPIHVAIAYGYTELVEVFLSHDPDLLYAKTTGALELDSFNLAHFYNVYFNQKEVFHFLKSYSNKNQNFFNETNLVHSDETEKLLKKEEEISNKNSNFTFCCNLL